MNPIAKTLVMAVLAAVTCAVAWHYYPKIEVVQSTERKQLLTDDEAFEPREVRRIRVEQFDRARNSLKDLELLLSQGSWVIPSKGNYPASNAERVASLVNAAYDKDVLEMVSDQKDDHEKYNVLELSEAGATGVGVGTVLTYEGRNRRPLARLIVGSTASRENQRYIRLAGQPQIYIVEMNESVLRTDLADWTDSDLLRFGAQTPNLAQLVQHIDVRLYFVDSDQLRGEGKKKHVYQVRIRFAGDRWVYDLWQPDDQQVLPGEPTLTDQDINLNQTLRQFVAQLRSFMIQDVSRKQNEVAMNLANPEEGASASQFDSLTGRGFRYDGFRNGQHQFDAAAGEINIVYKYGMETNILLGSLAGMDIASGGKINRYMLLTSDLNPSIIPEPKNPQQPPAGGDDASPAQEATEDQMRNYQAELNRRNELLEAAGKKTRSFNQVHADWLYVVSEDVISGLFPPVEAWKKPFGQ